ncbi:MAG: glycosyltransferase family 39 protein, partial [Pseudomonadota bacterium]
MTANDHVKTGLTAKGIKWAFTTTYPDYWHPLPWLSLMLDHEIYGLNPAGYHLTNLLLHILNTLLLFLILHRMTGALWRSAVVAALFALHPLHVESVAWITERKGLLSATFWLLTMGCYAWYVQHPGLKRFCLLLLSFALGLMSKPMIMTLPFVLLLLDYWPLSRFGFGKREGVHQKTKTGSAWILVLEKTPLFLLSAISFYVTLILRQGENIMISLEYRPLMLRVGNALTSYVQYIGNMIWPHDLAVFYPYPNALPLWKGVGAGLFVFAATLFIFRLLSRHP